MRANQVRPKSHAWRVLGCLLPTVCLLCVPASAWGQAADALPGVELEAVPVDVEPTRVERDEDGKIVRLDFMNRREFTDEHVRALVSLERLHSLGLGNTSVTAACIESLNDFPALESLGLGNNRWNASGLAELCVPGLKSLGLDYMKLNESSVRAIARHESLTFLGLGHTTMPTGWMEMLGGLTNLTSLEISGAKTEARELLALGQFELLEDLRMQEIPLGEHGIEILEGLPAALLELDVGNCGLDDRVLPALGHLEELWVLNLSGNAITDDGVATLAGFEKLEILGLNSTEITDAATDAILACSNLKEVGIFGTRLTDKGVQQLASQNLLETFP